MRCKYLMPTFWRVQKIFLINFLCSVPRGCRRNSRCNSLLVLARRRGQTCPRCLTMFGTECTVLNTWKMLPLATSAFASAPHFIEDTTINRHLNKLSPPKIKNGEKSKLIGHFRVLCCPNTFPLEYRQFKHRLHVWREGMLRSWAHKLYDLIWTHSSVGRNCQLMATDWTLQGGPEIIGDFIVGSSRCKIPVPGRFLMHC